VEALQSAAELGLHALDGGAKAAQVVAQSGGGEQAQIFLGEPVDHLVQLSERLRDPLPRLRRVLPRLRGTPSPGCAGSSPDSAGPPPRLRRVLPRLRGGETCRRHRAHVSIIPYRRSYVQAFLTCSPVAQRGPVHYA